MKPITLLLALALVLPMAATGSQRVMVNEEFTKVQG